jgi:hypothetical protein
VERSDTHHLVASPCEHAGMTGYRRNSQGVQQGDGFRKGSTHPTDYGLCATAAIDYVSAARISPPEPESLA